MARPIERFDLLAACKSSSPEDDNHSNNKGEVGLRPAVIKE
jgi:hypothetical protein